LIIYLIYDILLAEKCFEFMEMSLSTRDFSGARRNRVATPTILLYDGIV